MKMSIIPNTAEAPRYCATLMRTPLSASIKGSKVANIVASTIRCIRGTAVHRHDPVLSRRIETHLLHSIACSNLSVTSRAVRRVCTQRAELHLIMAAAVEGLAASSRSAITPRGPARAPIRSPDPAAPAERGGEAATSLSDAARTSAMTPRLSCWFSNINVSTWACSASVTSPSCWARCLVSSIKEAARQFDDNERPDGRWRLVRAQAVAVVMSGSSALEHRGPVVRSL